MSKTKSESNAAAPTSVTETMEAEAESGSKYATKEAVEAAFIRRDEKAEAESGSQAESHVDVDVETEAEAEAISITLTMKGGYLVLQEKTMQFCMALADSCSENAGNNPEDKLASALFGRVTESVKLGRRTTGVLKLSPTQVDSLRQRAGYTEITGASLRGNTYRKA